MSEYEQLKQAVEDNFVLLSLESRELKGLVGKQSDTLRLLHQSIVELQAGNRVMEDLLEKRTLRLDSAVEAIRALGTGSVDVRKEIAELKERMQRLEDKAS